MFLHLLFTLLVSAATARQLLTTPTAPVTVFTYELGSGPVGNTKFICLETNESFVSDANGWAHLSFSVGMNVTFFFPGSLLLAATQGATVVVPAEGLTSNITWYVLQIPNKVVYEIMMLVSPGHKDPTKCIGMVTVTAWDKTVADCPQGIEGVTVSVNPPLQSMIFYPGVWMGNRTDPFPNNLTSTSLDGGVAIENLPVGKTYLVTASKPGYLFTSTVLWCQAPGTFVNGAPNQGPRANHP